ncbi:hypothetical protein ACJMK2_017206 [Sinanodonta woodiana]|uniref:Vesicular, overexpressed in cancer, prosurvival protein 1 n=1 Tax=Sinanodonta woodiana TaxID=1069815 RepID=A0ABD3UZI6_SINWO
MAACNLHGNNTANCILGCCKEEGNTGYEVCCSLPLQSYLWILVAAILCILLAVVPYCWRTRCQRGDTRQGRDRLAAISRGTPQRGFSVAVVFTGQFTYEAYGAPPVYDYLTTDGIVNHSSNYDSPPPYDDPPTYEDAYKPVGISVVK